MNQKTYLLIIITLLTYTCLSGYAESDYIGTWEQTNVTTKIMLTLDVDYYELIISQKNSAGEYVDKQGYRGPLTVDGNLFLIQLLEYYYSRDGVYNWSEYYDEPYFYGQINIENDTLLWMIDFTEDGDYEDLHEQIEFIKL